MSASSWVVCKQRLNGRLVRVLEQRLELGEEECTKSLQLFYPLRGAELRAVPGFGPTP